MKAKKAEEKITAIYERLSRDDELVGESNSIVSCCKVGVRQERGIRLRIPDRKRAKTVRMPSAIA